MNPSSSGNLPANHRTSSSPLYRHHRHPRRRLHNFSLPNLSWGSQRILRCKVPVTAPPATRSPSESAAAAAVCSPWNLRTRRFRSSCNVPLPSHRHQSPSPEELKEDGEEEEEEQRARRRLLVSLSKEEIEEDFVKIKGSKPHRRPKKRARTVQRMLDKLFPGLWLHDITADSYNTNS